MTDKDICEIKESLVRLETKMEPINEAVKAVWKHEKYLNMAIGALSLLYGIVAIIIYIIFK